MPKKDVTLLLWSEQGEYFVIILVVIMLLLWICALVNVKLQTKSFIISVIDFFMSAGGVNAAGKLPYNTLTGEPTNQHHSRCSTVRPINFTVVGMDL